MTLRLPREISAMLVRANQGRRGFTFTHKPMGSARARRAVAAANAHGFTVNLSASSPSEADALQALGCAPVVTVLASGAPVPRSTPGGRPIIVCPSQRNKHVTCASCGLCARPDRLAVVGFLAHGQMKKRVSLAVLNG